MPCGRRTSSTDVGAPPHFALLPFHVCREQDPIKLGWSYDANKPEW